MQFSVKPLFIPLISLGLIACGGDSKNSNDQPAIKEISLVESSCPNNQNASGGSLWCWADPIPQGNTLKSLAMGNGEYLFSGDDGTLLFTQGFTTWENVNLNSEANSSYHAASYNSGLWMVSSDHGVVISEDKTKWEHVQSPAFSSLDHHYANGIWVSVGDNRTIATSKNGREWKINHIENDGGRWDALVSVYYGGGLWVTVGEDGTLFTSEDAENWVHRTINQPSRKFTDLIYIEDKALWVATSENQSYTGKKNHLYTSENGIDWNVTEVDTLFAFDDITYNEGLWVAISPVGQIHHSSNLQDWTLVKPNENDFRDLEGLNYDKSKGTWVAYGQGGLILTSEDAITWQYKVNSELESARAIAFDGTNRYIAVGKGNPVPVSYSNDGINWVSADKLVDSSGRDVLYLSDVAYGNGIWRATSYRSPFRSSDGISWNQETIDYGDLGWSLRDPEHLAYGKTLNRWVAISFNLGEVFVLDEEGDDAGTWKYVLRYDESPILGITKELLFDGEKWLVATSRSMYYSYDGLDWREAEYNAEYGSLGVDSISYGEGRYIALISSSSTNPLYAESEDGIQWDVKTWDIPNASSITFDNGEWYVVAWDEPSYVVYKSTDGTQWSEVPGGSPSSTIMRGRDKWVAGTKFGGLQYKAD